MKLVVENDLPRPRDVSSPAYVARVAQIRAALGEEMGLGHHKAYGGLAEILGSDAAELGSKEGSRNVAH